MRTVESFPLVLVTIIDSGCAIKSTPTTDRSITIVAAPTILFTGSQMITPLLVQSSEAGDESWKYPTSRSGVTSPLLSVVKLITVPSDSYLSCKFVPTSSLPLTVIWPTTSSVALGKIATNSGVTSILVFLIPGEEAMSTPPESVGVYVFNFQSIWNPAGLTILYQA